MTGWRLGYACGPEVILKQMLKIHQFAIMCAPTTSQYAAVEALKNGDDDVAEMREQLQSAQTLSAACLCRKWGCPASSLTARFMCSPVSRNSA